MTLARAKMKVSLWIHTNSFSLGLFSGLQGKNADTALPAFKLHLIHHPIRQLSADSNRLAWR